MTLLNLNNSSGSNSMDNKNLESACFDVVSKDLYYFNDDANGIQRPVSTDRIAIVKPNDDGGQVLYTPTNTYKLVHNKDIVAGLSTLTEWGFTPVKVRNINNKRFMFDMMYDSELTLNTQPCFIRVQVTNSYDGSTRLGLNFGVFIKVCSNGLIVNLNDAKLDLSYKHTSMLPNNIADFVYEKTKISLDYLEYKVRHVKFDADDQTVVAKFEKLKNMFYQSKKGVNPVVETILSRTAHEMKVNYEDGFVPNEEFALFMAITNMATHADQYMLSPANALILEQAATELWTNFSLTY